MCASFASTESLARSLDPLSWIPTPSDATDKLEAAAGLLWRRQATAHFVFLCMVCGSPYVDVGLHEAHLASHIVGGYPFASTDAAQCTRRLLCAGAPQRRTWRPPHAPVRRQHLCSTLAAPQPRPPGGSYSGLKSCPFDRGTCPQTRIAICRLLSARPIRKSNCSFCAIWILFVVTLLGVRLFWYVLYTAAQSECKHVYFIACMFNLPGESRL